MKPALRSLAALAASGILATCASLPPIRGEVCGIKDGAKVCASYDGNAITTKLELGEPEGFQK